MKKNIALFVINFFLSISLFAVVILSIFSNTILSKHYIIKTFEKSEYYEKTDAFIKNGFENYTVQAGLDKSVLDNLYDMQKLKNDINIMLNSVYENKELKIDTNGLKNTLDARINEILNKELSTEERKQVEEFEDNIIKTYESNVIYSQKYIGKLGETFKKVISILEKIEILFIVIVLVLATIIVFINKKNMEKSLKVFGIASLTAGTLGIFLKIIIGTRLDHIWLLSDAFSGSLAYLIKMINSKFLILGIMMMILGSLGIIIGNIKDDS